jgi:acyl-coenzyme A synthetase/AMP-(fatty) acid ligase
VTTKDHSLATDMSARRSKAGVPIVPAVPREIAVLDELPRGSTGKILRNELQSRVGS